VVYAFPNPGFFIVDAHSIEPSWLAGGGCCPGAKPFAVVRICGDRDDVI
jgi:hypothetical protein